MFSLLLNFASCRQHSHIRKYFRPHHHRYTTELDSLSANAIDQDLRTAACVSPINTAVMNQPKSSAIRIGSLSYGTVVYIDRHVYDWWEINWNEGTGYVRIKDVYGKGKVKNRKGATIYIGPATTYAKLDEIPVDTEFTIVDGVSGVGGFYKINYDGNKKGYIQDRYVQLLNYTFDDSNVVIRQTDSRLNSNIRRYGDAFLCICWIGGVNTIEGILQNYNTAIKNNWMNGACQVSFGKIIKLTNAYRWAEKSKDYVCGPNEKEILYCHNVGKFVYSHYVVGNGRGGIEYDPNLVGDVQYSDCTKKYIYYYDLY